MLQAPGSVWLTLEQHKRENDKLKNLMAQLQGELQAALAKRSRLEAQRREDEAALARAERQLQALRQEHAKTEAGMEAAISHAQSR